MKTNVAILGAGNFGTVLALLAHRASKGKREVWLYDHEPSKIEDIRASGENRKSLPGVPLPKEIHLTASLEEACSRCILIMPVIPSRAMRALAAELAKHVRGDHLIVHCTKGFEPGTHKRMSEVLVEETGILRLGAFSGPNLAAELAQGLPGATVIASPFEEVRQTAAQAFASPGFRVETSTDMAGVELIGALKNVLALSSGFCTERGLGQNAVGTTLTRILHELSFLMERSGAERITVFSLAGFGDIIATCTSPLSRNFRAGQALAQGKVGAQIEAEARSTVEGLSTVAAVKEMAENHGLTLPLIQQLWKLCQGTSSPEAFTEQLLR